MIIPDWAVILYEGPSGECPVGDFCRALSVSDPEGVVLLNEAVRRLRGYGPNPKLPDFRWLNGGSLARLVARSTVKKKQYWLYVGVHIKSRAVVLLQACEACKAQTERTIRADAEGKFTDFLYRFT